MIELIFKYYIRQFIHTTFFSRSSLVNLDELKNTPNDITQHPQTFGQKNFM